jgi:hypothetical protein
MRSPALLNLRALNGDKKCYGKLAATLAYSLGDINVLRRLESGLSNVSNFSCISLR